MLEKMSAITVKFCLKETTKLDRLVASPKIPNLNDSGPSEERIVALVVYLACVGFIKSIIM